MSSLMDAFLLEPPGWRVQGVFIAKRSDLSDGLGSGTQSDPWRPIIRNTPSIAVTLDKNGVTAIAIVNSQDYSEEDNVTISGAAEPLFNGTFTIFGVQSNGGQTTFHYTMPAVPANGPGGNPTCYKIIYELDDLVASLPPGMLINLGPGIFDLRGLAESNTKGWKIKSGQRIRGAGMYSTVLRIVGGTISGRSYAAFGNEESLDNSEYLDGFTAEELTVDCNVDGQPNSHTDCGAIAIRGGGRHLRIRNVRAIHFGSKGTNDVYRENFVFYFANNNGSPPVSDLVVEGCVAELPSPNISWNSTIFQIGGKEVNGISNYHRGCVLRKNYVNCQIVYGQRAEVSSINFTGGIATVITKSPHGLSKPGNVSVEGVLVGGSAENEFNGVFAIEDPPSETELTYRPYSDPGGTAIIGVGAIVGAPVSPHRIPVLSVVPSVDPPAPHTPGVIRITTQIAHNKTTNNLIKFGNIYVRTAGGELIPPSTPFQPTDNPFSNRALQIVAVHSKTVLDVLLDKPEPAAGYTAYGAYGTMFTGEGHYALSADNGTAAVVENNRILHCFTGGPWHDTWSTRDLIARRNYYSDVANGPNQSGGGPLPGTKTAQSLIHDGRIATFETGGALHDLVVGQGISISLASVGGVPSQEFNGIFAVRSVKSATSFTYEMTNVPQGNADNSSVPQVQPLTIVGSWLIEDNIIELALTHPDYWAEPTGIGLFLGDPNLLSELPYAFRQVIIRRNVITQLAPAFASTYGGITVQKAERLIIENNVIGLGQLVPIQFQKCGSVKLFNNRSSDGKLILGLNRDTQQNQGEVQTLIDDAILLSI